MFCFIELKFFRSYPSLKRHILFYRNGLAIWHGFPDTTHIMDNNGHEHFEYDEAENFQDIPLLEIAYFVL